MHACTHARTHTAPALCLARRQAVQKQVKEASGLTLFRILSEISPLVGLETDLGNPLVYPGRL